MRGIYSWDVNDARRGGVISGTTYSGKDAVLSICSFFSILLHLSKNKDVAHVGAKKLATLSHCQLCAKWRGSSSSVLTTEAAT